LIVAVYNSGGSSLFQTFQKPGVSSVNKAGGRLGQSGAGSYQTGKVVLKNRKAGFGPASQGQAETFSL
jgi:hypothetical protein